MQATGSVANRPGRQAGRGVAVRCGAGRAYREGTGWVILCSGISRGRPSTAIEMVLTC